MMDPMVQDYLSRYREGLRSLPVEEQDSLVEELASEINEDIEAGQPLADILAELGPPELLAQQDLVLVDADEPAEPLSVRLARLLSQVRRFSAYSVPTFVVIIVLGSLILALGLVGLGAIVGSIITFSGSLPEYGAGAAVVVAGGLLLLLAAWGCYRLLVRYLQQVSDKLSDAKET